MKKLAYILLSLAGIALLSWIFAATLGFPDEAFTPDAPFFGWASLFATPFHSPVSLLMAHIFAGHYTLGAFVVCFVRILPICIIVWGLDKQGGKLALAMAFASLLVYSGVFAWIGLFIAMLFLTFSRKPRVKNLLAIWGIPLANFAALAALGWTLRGDPLDPLRLPSPKEFYISFAEPLPKRVFDNDYLRNEIKDRIDRLSDSPIVFVIGSYSRNFATEEPFVWQPFGDIPPTPGKDVYVLVPEPVGKRRNEAFNVKDKRFYGLGKKGWRMIGTFQGWHLFRVEAK